MSQDIKDRLVELAFKSEDCTIIANGKTFHMWGETINIFGDPVKGVTTDGKNVAIPLNDIKQVLPA